MIDVKGSSRHPLGQLAYRIISGNVWYDARTVLEDQKIGVRLFAAALAPGPLSFCALTLTSSHLPRP